MKLRDRKAVIFHQLSQEPRPVALLELIAKLGSGYKDRTTRRLLNELVQEGLVQKSGVTKSARYIAVKEPVLNEEDGSFFGQESQSVVELIRRPLSQRMPVAYNNEWFDSYKPNVDFYMPLQRREELHKAGRRASVQDPAGTYAHQIFNRLLIDLSYNSSRLEGNTYSLLDTERLLLHGDSAEGKLDEEKAMILNHKDAIRYLVENAPRIGVNITEICTLHYLLSDGLVESKFAGKIRDEGVRIGGSTYIPFEDVKKLESQLLLITQKAAKIKDPFEQSFFLLVHISYLQAFIDVNKRTARLAANIPLIAKNLVPLSFVDIEVSEYMSAMIAIYELQDIRPLVDLYVYSYMRTCVAYDATVKALGFDEVRVKYRRQRRDVIREVIVQRLSGIGLSAHVDSAAKRNIPDKDREAFVQDFFEDLEQMDESRLAGLGITSEQLQEWLRLKR